MLTKIVLKWQHVCCERDMPVHYEEYPGLISILVTTINERLAHDWLHSTFWSSHNQRSILRVVTGAYSDRLPTLYMVLGRDKPVLRGPNRTESNLFHHGETNHLQGWVTAWICYWHDPQNRSLLITGVVLVRLLLSTRVRYSLTFRVNVTLLQQERKLSY